LTILFRTTGNWVALGHGFHLLPKSITYNYYFCN
jgi:hypothetical protein